MVISNRKISKTLEKKITQLNDIIADIDSMLTEMQTEYYRVSIFQLLYIRIYIYI